MKKKTLLSRKNIATVLVAGLVVGISPLLGGCSSMNELVKIIQNMEEEERLEEARKKEETKRETLDSKLEKIYSEYLKGDRNFVGKFNSFLKKNFTDKEQERILYYLRLQNIFNEDRKEEYEQAKASFEEALNEGKISKEEFEAKEEQLWNKYLEDRNQIYDYLEEEEEHILENCEEEIQELYELI